ncbi:MAG: transcriptional regulator [Promethearchaeota archaeon]
MPIIMHEELVARYLIPAIKREISEELTIRGYRPAEIARILHVTPAAITQYLNQKRAQRVNFPLSIKRVIRQSVDLLLQSESATLLRQELNKIIEASRRERILCDLHKELDPWTPEDCCSMCIRSEYCQGTMSC